jgi:hypothetical protein
MQVKFWQGAVQGCPATAIGSRGCCVYTNHNQNELQQVEMSQYWVHLKLSPLFWDCGQWGHCPRLTALAGVLTRQLQFEMHPQYLVTKFIVVHLFCP